MTPSYRCAKDDDSSKQDNFYLVALKEAMERFEKPQEKESVSEPVVEKPKEESPKVETKVEIPEEDDDDLPF